MRETDKAELLELLSKLSQISAVLAKDWERRDKRLVKERLEALEAAVKLSDSSTNETHSALFSDRVLFPTREAIVAYLDSELGVHLSPDWQRTRLEREAAIIASKKSPREIRAAADRLAKAHWIVKKPVKATTWQNLFGKGENQIRAELGDTERYPAIDDLKKLAAGLLSYDQMKSITKRETLIEKIVAEVMRHSGVSKLGE